MKNYLLWFLLLCVTFSYAQTISLPQRLANYTVVSDGGGAFDQGTDQLGMWANGAGNDQSLVFRAFDSNGDGTGSAVTMDAGDSFKITLAAKRAWGEIGVALLNNPTTATWADRKSNYTAYCILSGPNGESGALTNWKAHSTDGGSETFSVGGNETTETDFVITFSITATDKITVDINGESKVLTVASPNSTHFSVWLYDDWTGTANSNIYLKPTTELVQATLTTEDISDFSNELIRYVFDNTIEFKKPLKHRLNWTLYDLTGKGIQKSTAKEGESVINIIPTPKGIYLLEVSEKNFANRKVFKLIRK